MEEHIHTVFSCIVATLWPSSFCNMEPWECHYWESREDCFVNSYTKLRQAKRPCIRTIVGKNKMIWIVAVFNCCFCPNIYVLCTYNCYIALALNMCAVFEGNCFHWGKYFSSHFLFWSLIFLLTGICAFYFIEAYS